MAKTLTYDEYLKRQQTSALDAAKVKQDLANEAADKTYDTDVALADQSYQQHMNRYGAQQQQLADMGLAGSGYQHYLGDRAYAASVAAKQAASAQRAESKRLAKADYDVAKASADAEYNSKYAAWMLDKENTVKSAMQGLSGLEAIEALDRLVASGDITTEDKLYGTLMNGALADVNKKIQGGTLFTKADGTQMSKAEADELLNAIDTYAPDYATAAREELNTHTETLNPKTHINVNGYTLGIDAGEFASADEGDKIKVWFGSTKFKVNKGAEVTDSAVVAAARTITAPGPVVFGLGDAIYVANSGKAYKIEKRNDNQYEKLYDFVFKDTPTSASTS